MNIRLGGDLVEAIDVYNKEATNGEDYRPEDC
jgi:hypothetical protein